MLCQIFVDCADVIKVENTKCPSCYCLVAGSLESANSSILAARRLFKEVVGKNQDFMLIRLANPSNLIGCGGGHVRVHKWHVRAHQGHIRVHKGCVRTCKGCVMGT